MQALVILRRRLQQIIHLPPRSRYLRRQRLARTTDGTAIRRSSSTDKYSILGLHTRNAVRRPLGRPAREVQVHGGRFEQVHGDFVEVGDEAVEVAGDVALVVELLEAAPDVDVLAFGGEGLRGRGVGVLVSPVLDVDEAGAVVDFEGCVGGLLEDAVDLADEGELGVLLGWSLGRGGRVSGLGDVLGLLRCRRS